LLASLATVGQVETTNLTATTPLEQIDLVLDLSTQPIDPDQLNRARNLGYWTFIYGAKPERTTPGLQEILSSKRASHARLVRLETLASGTILREGTIKTVMHSPKGTQQRLLDAILDWPARALREHSGSDASPSSYNDLRIQQPSLIKQLLRRVRLPVALTRNLLTRLYQETSREHWAIGVIPQSIQQVAQAFDPDKIRWLPEPTNGFLADPFGIARADGTLTILAEALWWNEHRGRIVAFDAKADGTATELQDVFDFSTHASYPQLIEHEGNIYCIPETCAQRRVQLFRAEAFPNKWVPDTILLDNFPGADATVYFYQDRWWLFVGNNDDQDETKLYLFHADNLRGPWLPHTENPVKSDLRSARPAGSLFTVGGELFRPAQDCSVTYGGAIAINKIETLTPVRFVEQTVKRLRPAVRGPYPNGLHTLSAAGQFTLVDGKRHAWSAAELCKKLSVILHLRPRKG
jgi:hypothetical protein